MKKFMFWLGVGACLFATIATGTMVYARLFWNGADYLPYNQLEVFYTWHFFLFLAGIILAGPVAVSMKEDR